MTVTVIEEIKNLIPSLSSIEYEQLESSISEHGLLHPIQTGHVSEYGTFVLDGHNRHSVCEKLGIDCRYTENPITFESLEAAKLWAINLQLGRRNISCDFVRGELVLKKKELIQAEALKRKSTGGSQHMQNSAGAENGETRKILAKEIGISHNTLDKIEKLTKAADPETLKLLRSKEISINKAYNSLMPAKEQESAIETNGQSIIAKIQKLINQFFEINETPSNDDLKSIGKIIDDLQSVVDTAPRLLEC